MGIVGLGRLYSREVDPLGGLGVGEEYLLVEFSLASGLTTFMGRK